MGKTVIDRGGRAPNRWSQGAGNLDWRPMTYEAIRRFATRPGTTSDSRGPRATRARVAVREAHRTRVLHVALIAGIFFDLWRIKKTAMWDQLRGSNKVRFPAPLKEEAAVPAQTSSLGDVAEESPNGVEGLLKATVEMKENPKPACVAELVFRFYGADTAARQGGRPSSSCRALGDFRTRRRQVAVADPKVPAAGPKKYESLVEKAASETPMGVPRRLAAGESGRRDGSNAKF